MDAAATLSFALFLVSVLTLLAGVMRWWRAREPVSWRASWRWIEEYVRRRQ